MHGHPADIYQTSLSHIPTMLSRHRSRIAQRSDRSRIAHRSDSSSEGSPSPCPSPPTTATMKPTFPLRRKFHLHLLHFRISSLLRLVKSLRISCRHALQALLSKKPKKRSPPSKARVGTAFSAQCTRSACAPDAIADCIEFIKRSASSSSSSSSSSSQPTSPSHSSPSSPSLSSQSSISVPSRFLSPSSQRAPSSLSHHAHSSSSQYSPLHSNHASYSHHSNSLSSQNHLSHSSHSQHSNPLSSQNPLSHSHDDNSPSSLLLL